MVLNYRLLVLFEERRCYLFLAYVHFIMHGGVKCLVFALIIGFSSMHFSAPYPQNFQPRGARRRSLFSHRPRQQKFSWGWGAKIPWGVAIFGGLDLKTQKAYEKGIETPQRFGQKENENCQTSILCPPWFTNTVTSLTD